MPAPRFSYANLLADSSNVSISSTMGELDYPTLNLFNKSPLTRLRSDMQTFRIDSKNDKLNFNIGASELTSTLSHGQYRAQELEGEVATQMNTTAAVSNITCVYDQSTSQFTIAKVTGTLQLLCATGTNKQVSVFSSLGFDCSSDKTGALTYTGTYFVNSTFGHYEITTSNQKFYFKRTGGSDLTATITAGHYSARSLCSELKYQLDTQDSVTLYDATFDESLLKFIIKRGTGTFELRFGAFSINTASDVFGFPNTNQTALTTVTATNVRIHTDETITFAFITAQELSVLMLTGYNWQSTGTYKIQANDTDSWSSPSYDSGALTFDAWKMIIFPGSPPTRLFVRILIVDKTNPNGFVELGTVWGGDYFELGRAVNYGRLAGAAPLVVVGTTDDGVLIGSIKSKVDKLQYEFQAVSHADYLNLKTLLDTIETVFPFVGVFRYDTSGNPELSESGLFHFRERPDFKESDVVGNQETFTISLMEFI